MFPSGVSHDMNAFCFVFVVGQKFSTPSIWPEINVSWFLETRVRWVLTGKTNSRVCSSSSHWDLVTYLKKFCGLC